MICRLLLSCAAILALVPSFAGAAPVFISGLGSSYVPGSPLSFQVGLPTITDLGAYNIDLLLTSTEGIAGTDYFFDVSATQPAAAGYIFPTAANYFDAANLDSPSQQRLTLSDFDFSGINVVTGVNDLVATVVVQTAANFSGKLHLSVASDGLILDTPADPPTSVQEFDVIKSDTLTAGDIALAPIPEPSSAVLAAIAFVLSITALPSWRSRRD